MIKSKNNHSLKLIGAAILLLVVCLLLTFRPTAPEKSDISQLYVNILKIGKADSIVLQTEDKVMLIDTGETENADKIKDFLEDNKISKIDSLIITHYDKDHVGGASSIADSFEIGDVYMPDYEGSRPEYSEFLDALNRKSVKAKRLRNTISFNMADCSVTIDPPLSYDIADNSEEYDNDFSLITTVVHGENTLVFTGDAEDKRTNEWLSGVHTLSCNLLKMPHHGRYHETTEYLISALAPQYTVICDSQKHPAAEETLEILKAHQTEIYETRYGTVTAISDGKKLTVIQKGDGD